MTDSALSTPPSTTSPGRRWPIHPWLLIPLGLFLLLATIQVSFVIRMVGHDIDSVEGDAYTRSMAFDAERAAFDRFDEIGLELSWHPAAEGATVFVLAGGGGAIELDDVRLAFYRPADADLDQEVAWTEPAEPLALALPRAGTWRVVLAATHDDESVRSTLTLHR